MFACVEDLDRALQAAELELAQRETGATRHEERQAGVAGVSQAAEGDAPEELDESTDLGEHFETLEGLLSPALEALTTFGTEAGEVLGSDLATLSAAQMRVRLIGAAARLKEPSDAVFEHCGRLQTAVEEADVLLRGLVEQMRAVELPEVQDQVDALVMNFHDESGELREAASMVHQLIEMLKLVSLMNVALRKTLRPGIRGLQSLSSAVSTVRSWERLSASGGDESIRNA